MTAASGAGNTTWTVVRGQQGSAAAAAAAGATVSLAGGWPTSTQMTPSDIATALGAVRQAAAGLLSASTTLAAAIGAGDTTITVASDQGFPVPNFSVAIGSEILQVTGVGGTGNTTWTVVRGQQGTTPAAATSGTAVTPTGADLDGVVIAATASGAHTSGGAGIANDVSALILQTLTMPGTAQTLLTRADGSRLHRLERPDHRRRVPAAVPCDPAVRQAGGAGPRAAVRGRRPQLAARERRNLRRDRPDAAAGDHNPAGATRCSRC